MSVVATDASAAEAGPDAGTFTISRTGSTAAALTVGMAFSGTAIGGVDYAAQPGSIVIPAGQSSVTVTLTPIDDSAIEGAETAILQVQSAAGYDVGSPSSATVTIADNDQAASSGSGGGGGAIDLLALLGALGMTTRQALRRRQPPASSFTR